MYSTTGLVPFCDTIFFSLLSDSGFSWRSNSFSFGQRARSPGTVFSWKRIFRLVELLLMKENCLMKQARERHFKVTRCQLNQVILLWHLIFM